MTPELLVFLPVKPQPPTHAWGFLEANQSPSQSNAPGLGCTKAGRQHLATLIATTHSVLAAGPSTVASTRPVKAQQQRCHWGTHSPPPPPSQSLACPGLTSLSLPRVLQAPSRFGTLLATAGEGCPPAVDSWGRCNACPTSLYTTARE